MKYLLIACLIAVIISHFCDAHEYLYDQDDSDLNWLYDNQVYGHGYYGDFDDYVPNSYRKSVHYPPITSYYPRTYYVDDWNDDLPVYLPYESLPRIQKKPVYFAPPPPPTTPQPSDDGYHYPAPESKYLPPIKEAIPFAPIRNPAPKKVEHPSTDGYHYPAPEFKYLPPNKEAIPFAPTKKPVPPSSEGYHYPAPETKYLPPTREPIPFAPTKKPEAPKTVYLPPKPTYLPPTRKPTTATPKTTTRLTTTRATTPKPSTPKSLYLPPIVVPEPSVVSEYLPPPRELAHNLQPPPVSGGKPILFH